jgi:hypothetical protein
VVGYPPSSDVWPPSAPSLDAELAGLRDQVAKLRAENARLLRLLELSPAEAQVPEPVQTGMFDAAPGAVHVGSPPEAKVAFYAALFAARTDVYAVRRNDAATARSRRPSNTYTRSRTQTKQL